MKVYNCDGINVRVDIGIRFVSGIDRIPAISTISWLSRKTNTSESDLRVKSESEESFRSVHT